MDAGFAAVDDDQAVVQSVFAQFVTQQHGAVAGGQVKQRAVHDDVVLVDDGTFFVEVGVGPDDLIVLEVSQFRSGGIDLQRVARLADGSLGAGGVDRHLAVRRGDIEQLRRVCGVAVLHGTAVAQHPDDHVPGRLHIRLGGFRIVGIRDEAIDHAFAVHRQLLILGFAGCLDRAVGTNLYEALLISVRVEHGLGVVEHIGAGLIGFSRAIDPQVLDLVVVNPVVAVDRAILQRHIHMRELAHVRRPVIVRLQPVVSVDVGGDHVGAQLAPHHLVLTELDHRVSVLRCLLRQVSDLQPGGMVIGIRPRGDVLRAVILGGELLGGVDLQHQAGLRHVQCVGDAIRLLVVRGEAEPVDAGIGQIHRRQGDGVVHHIAVFVRCLDERADEGHGRAGILRRGRVVLRLLAQILPGVAEAQHHMGGADIAVVFLGLEGAVIQRAGARYVALQVLVSHGIVILGDLVEDLRAVQAGLGLVVPRIRNEGVDPISILLTCELALGLDLLEQDSGRVLFQLFAAGVEVPVTHAAVLGGIVPKAGEHAAVLALVRGVPVIDQIELSVDILFRRPAPQLEHLVVSQAADLLRPVGAVLVRVAANGLFLVQRAAHQQVLYAVVGELLVQRACQFLCLLLVSNITVILFFLVIRAGDRLAGRLAEDQADVRSGTVQREHIAEALPVFRIGLRLAAIDMLDQLDGAIVDGHVEFAALYRGAVDVVGGGEQLAFAIEVAQPVQLPTRQIARAIHAVGAVVSGCPVGRAVVDRQVVHLPDVGGHLRDGRFGRDHNRARPVAVGAARLIGDGTVSVADLVDLDFFAVLLFRLIGVDQGVGLHRQIGRDLRQRQIVDVHPVLVDLEFQRIPVVVERIVLALREVEVIVGVVGIDRSVLIPVLLPGFDLVHSRFIQLDIPVDILHHVIDATAAIQLEAQRCLLDSQRFSIVNVGEGVPIISMNASDGDRVTLFTEEVIDREGGIVVRQQCVLVQVARTRPERVVLGALRCVVMVTVLIYLLTVV